MWLDGPAQARASRVCAILACLGTAEASALPDFGQRETVNGVALLRDREDASRYYALPNGVGLRLLPDGGPDMSFIVARYSGSRVRDDSGRVDILSILRLGVTVEEPPASALQDVETVLEMRDRRDVTIERLLPSGMAARLVYTSAGTPEDIVADRAYEEAASEQAVWRERSIVLGFSAETAQLIDSILETESAGLSLAWTIYAEGWGPERIDGSTTSTSVGAAGETGLSAEGLAEAVDDALGAALPEQVPERQAVLGDAIALKLSESERASRLVRYDIDAALPPSYPSLAAYCFTFRNGLREDVWQRSVDVEARGLTGGAIATEAVFTAEQPQDYAESIRFRYAVDLREPYRWRVRDILMSGEEVVGDWTTSESWTAIIDITNALPVSGRAAPDGGARSPSGEEEN